MDGGLRDSVVLVTGAAGGIGFACAEAFAAEGAKLVLHAGRTSASLEARVEKTTWRERTLVGAGDLRDPNALDALLALAHERFGRPDVAVLSAGIWPPESRPLHEMDPARIREVVEVDLLGTIFSARAFLREIARGVPRADGRGASLCLIGSTAGHFGEAGHAEYAVSKAALVGLVRSVKNEIVGLDPYGRINMVEPGWVASPMAEPSLREPGVIEKVLATMPLRQLARPQDIASAVLFLSSPTLARHVTGEILKVAGGMEGRRLWRPEDIDPDLVRRRVRE